MSTQMSGHGTPIPMTSRPCGPLKGEANVPGDKSISHRSLILGALAFFLLLRPVVFALSAATFLNAKTDACWFSLMAGRPALDTRRGSHWRMNLAFEPLSRCCIILSAERNGRFRTRSRWLMWPC